MTTEERARAMRADGKSVAQIATRLGIHKSYAYRCIGDLAPNTPLPDAASVIRYGAHNGGCSTLSGMMPVRMPRITALHGAAA